MCHDNSTDFFHWTWRCRDSWSTWHVHHISTLGQLPSYIPCTSLLSLWLSRSPPEALFDTFYINLWISLSTPASFLCVYITPPSHLLDLFAMPARGYDLSSNISVLTFPVTRVTWEVMIKTCWAYSIKFHFHLQFVILNHQLCAFILNPFYIFISFFITVESTTDVSKVKSWSIIVLTIFSEVLLNF